MKKIFSILIGFQFLSLFVSAQKNAPTTKWKAEPFDNNVFVENKGQFNGALPDNQVVFYEAQLGTVRAYFTINGIVYASPEVKHENGTPLKKEEAKDKNEKTVMHYVSAFWKGAVWKGDMDAAGKQSYEYAYPAGKTGSTKVNVFKKITYKNLYPGIDAEYCFAGNKAGIKYSLIIHPGADVDAARLEYSGADSIKQDTDGNVVISSSLGVITDHKPSSYYQSGAPLGSKSNLKGYDETFSVLGYYNKSKTIIIDPWTTSTSFTGLNSALDLDYDKYGNVYVFGGLVSVGGLLQLVKYSAAGVKQWVYNASAISGASPDSYGDIATDKASGTTYILQGYGSGYIYKVNSLGTLVTSFLPTSPSVDEYWRADFDQCNHQIIIGAGGTTNPYQAARIDTNLTTLTPINIFASAEAFHDITLLTIDPYSNSCFMCSAKNVTDTLYANKLVKLPLPSLTPTAFAVGNGYGFNEVGSIPIAGYQGWENANGMNGAAASPNWVYLYNGDTLKQFSKVTGKLNASLGISKIPFKTGGLDVDPCDNIYIGNAKNLLVYNSSFSLTSTISLPDSVYDVHLGPNNALYACGQNFVECMVAPGNKNIVTTITYPTTCSSCNGKAMASPGCGKAPFTYLWSNGETNQTDTGLCPGIYTVTVTDAACSPDVDTAVVDISGKLGYGASITDSMITCYKPLGSLFIHATGGTTPYSYTWSNGETSQKDSGLTAGIYNCTVTDSNGCKYTTSADLVNPSPPVLTIVPPYDSVCNGVSVSLMVSGAKTYTWSPAVSLSCTNCPNPIATPTANTWYTVVGTDSLGCVNKDSVVVAFSPPPTVTVSSFPDGCFGTFLEAFGATSYSWAPDTGLSCYTCQFTSATDTVAVTYTVYGYQHGCADSATVTVPATTAPVITATASKDTICVGDSVKLTAVTSSSLLFFYWFPSAGVTCSTCMTTYVHPTVTTSYEAYGYDSSGCAAIAFVTIIVNGVGVTSTSFGCGGPTYLSASGSSSGTYTWAPATGLSCTNCQFPIATPTVATTYTVYGASSSACPGHDSAVVVVVPSVAPTISIKVVPDTICAGDSVLLSGTSKGAPTHYWFSTGGGIITCDTCLKTYMTVTSTTTVYFEAFDSAGCFADTLTTITVNPKVTVTSTTDTCAGKTTLTATGSAGYTWAPSTGLSATTGATVIATPTVNTSYTVTGTAGCPGGDTAIIKVVALPPLATVTVTTVHDTVCPGDSTTIKASGSGITSYSWYPSTGVNCDGCATTAVQVNGLITYTCYVTNAKGCNAFASITLHTGSPAPIAKKYYTCPSNSVTLNASGGTSYTWNTGAHSSSITVTPASTTTYSVAVVLSAGCIDTEYHTVDVNPLPAGSLCCSSTITSGQSVTLNASGGSSYIWSPATGLSCTSCASPVASPTVTTTYYVTFISDSGCVSKDSLVVTVKENCSSGFDVPNVFTPNGDNDNDVLSVDASNMTTYSIEVFDRWGTKVYSSTNAADPWNGKRNNSGTDVTDGVYYYVIKASCGNTNFEKKGFVQLIR